MAKKISKQLLTDMAALGFGAVVGSKIVNIDIPLPIPANFKPAIPVVLGFLLQKKGSSMMKHAGAGMVAVGLLKLAAANFPQLGIGAESISDYYVEGFPTQRALAGGDGGETITGPQTFNPLSGTDYNSDLVG